MSRGWLAEYLRIDLTPTLARCAAAVLGLEGRTHDRLSGAGCSIGAEVQEPPLRSPRLTDSSASTAESSAGPTLPAFLHRLLSCWRRRSPSWSGEELAASRDPCRSERVPCSVCSPWLHDHTPCRAVPRAGSPTPLRDTTPSIVKDMTEVLGPRPAIRERLFWGEARQADKRRPRCPDECVEPTYTVRSLGIRVSRPEPERVARPATPSLGPEHPSLRGFQLPGCRGLECNRQSVLLRSDPDRTK